MDRPLNILVVDDDPDFVEALEEMLESHDYEVATATSADQFKETLAGSKPQVALIDVRFGRFNGIDLVATLKERAPEILCVVMTAYAEIETSIAALRQGAYDFLRKPFHPEELFAVLNRCAEKLKLQADLQASHEQLLQSQKMETIGTLAGGVAHDFNNLLTAILGNAEFGILDLEPTHKAYPNFVEIKKAAIQASELTHQLLSFSHRQELQRKYVDLNGTIKDMMKMLRRIVGEDVALETSFAAGKTTVLADPGQLRQVLMNLCANARDAMPAGGALSIKTERVSVREVEGGGDAVDTIQFSVSDTGVGMDAETREHIFEPFFTTKEIGKGTGLGLSVVFGIVNQHGGAIEVESEIGKGTTFRVLLPCASEKATVATDKATVTVVPGAAETILVLEDDETVRNVAIRILTGLSYKVLAAENDQEAMKIFSEDMDDIDLVMLDVVLPKKSGPEVYAEMKALKPDLPALFVTGYAADQRLEALQLTEEQRSRCVLQKPYSKDALSRMIRGLLHANTGASA